MAPSRETSSWNNCWLFVHVTTDEGIVGVGEATNPLGGANSILHDSFRYLREALVGEDASDITRLWQKVYRRYTYISSSGFATTLLGGLDTALWDIKGQALNRPIYDLLGGRVRESVALYANTWFAECGTPEDFAVAAKMTVSEGFGALKFDPFHEMHPYHSSVKGAIGVAAPSGYLNGDISREGLEDGLAIFGAVRDAVGWAPEILFDAHGHYNVATAIKVGRAVRVFEPAWFEEPVPPGSFDALRRVRDAVDISLSVGERLFSRYDFVPVLTNHLSDYVMPDVSWCGGISELVKIANLAEAHYIPISPHCVFGPIAAIASAHAMMTVPNFTRQEFNTADFEEYNLLLDRPLDVRNGTLHLPDRPGLGFGLQA